MNAQAIEREQQLLACLDEVLDAPHGERTALIRSRLGDDESLVRELERLIVAVEQPDEKYLGTSVDVMLQPVLTDLAEHSRSDAEIPAALVAALAPRYTVLERIGSGGMASVYLGFDTTLGRNVAIKRLRPELADSLSLERFEREINIAATISHPRVVPVYDRGNAGGQLYYIMPFLSGGSLRELLMERPQLEIRKAIDIARDVAEALDAAHAKNVVHRDIKPANILLDDHGAYVADFGIARVLDAAGREYLTRTGIALGTALYMSPEQVSAPTTVDRRCDVYALACVLYEMLAGEAPFTGPTQREIMAKHLAAAIPDLTVVRATVTRAMQQVIATALQKAPADRYASAGEFINAFERAWLSPPGDDVDVTPAVIPTREPRVAFSSVRMRFAASITLGIAVVGLGAWGLSLGRDTVSLDPDLHVVFPFDVTGVATMDAAQRLREALAKWTGVRVVDQFTLNGKLKASRPGTLDVGQATSLARSVGARRFIRGSVQPEGEFVRLAATLFDIDSGRLAEVPVRVRRDLVDSDSIMEALAERLLFRNATTNARVEPSIGTTNYAGRSAYLLGHDAVRQWDLVKADSAFARAAFIDGNYAQASLWLAQVRFWREEPPSRWRDFVERAIAGRLSVRERSVAKALQLWANNQVVESCGTWERVAAGDQHDGLLWYSAHKCRFRDNVVLQNPANPNRWHFRSSHHLALAHLERALELTPTIYRGFRQNGFEQLRVVLKTNAGAVRSGRSTTGQGNDFAAYPMLSNDTLAFVPIPMSELGERADAARHLRPMIELALQRQRQRFRAWATTWVSNYPQSAEAWEALAVALETLGDASALDTIAHARRLARSRAEQQRIIGTQTWLLVKFSLPGDREGLRRARHLADSSLRFPDAAAGDRQLLVSLAALTGRLSFAKAQVRLLSDWPRRHAPVDVNDAGGRLLLHSALGGPPSELSPLERGADSAIRLAISDSDLIAVRKDILGRSAAFAFPTYLLSSLRDSSFRSDLLFRALQQWLAGDRQGVAATLEALRKARGAIPAANIQFDKLLPEARLIKLAEGPSQAVQWIDPTLAAIRAGSHMNLLEPVRAASLVGTMALRADLADRLGDRETAKLWAAAVAELWADCDQSLCPIRDRMRALTR